MAAGGNGDVGDWCWLRSLVGGGSRGEVWLWKGGTRFCSCLGIGDGKFGVH